MISVQQCLFQHSIFHRQICNHAEQRLSQPLGWSCNHFRFLDFEEREHLFPLGWWMLLAFCFAKFKLCPDLHRESIEAFPQNQRERRIKLRNWEYMGKRRITKFIRYGRLNVNTAYETLSYFIFIDIYLSIPFTSVRSSTWIMPHGRICPLKACFLLLMLV